MSIITITRGALQRTFTFTETLATSLNAKTISREDVIDHGKKYGLDRFELSKLGLLEKRPPVIWDRWKEQRDTFLILYKASLMDLVSNGNVVYVGNIGRFVLSDIPRLFRIRLDATKKYRIEHRMLDSGDNRAEASEFVDRIDQQREEWVKFLYNVDYYEHANYDLVLNIETLSVESMVKIAKTTVSLPEFTQDEQTTRMIRDIHLESQVLAQLKLSPRTRGMQVKVKCDAEKGVVTVRGSQPMVGIDIWKSDVEAVAKSIEGVQTVEIVD